MTRNHALACRNRVGNDGVMDPFAEFDVGYDIPAKPGMAEDQIQTPALVLDLDALERNLLKMGDFARSHGMRLRAHGKMHKSVDVAKLQIEIGGAIGICCQKVSEAEAFARGGIDDILVTNQTRDPLKINRLAQLPRFGARIGCCVDDVSNVVELSQATQHHGTQLDCLVEIDVGAGRCGVKTAPEAVAIAQAIEAAPGLNFRGLQAYQGEMQHLETFEERRARCDTAIAQVKDVLAALAAADLTCDIVSGAGTGSYKFESKSSVFNELQCGSYAFMDADYGRVLDESGNRLDQGEWENALFLLTSVMSQRKPGMAIVDAGLKVQSVDSGLPVVFGWTDIEYVKCSDEHGTVTDPRNVPKVSDRLRLVPGHCDPTCNLHDWYVGVRGGVVETLWPVTARGRAF